MQYKRPPIPQGEREQSVFTGALNMGGRPVVGGQHILTDSTLNYAPVDTDAPRSILTYGAKITGVPGVGVANDILDRTALLEPKSIPYTDIQSVEPRGRSSFFSPPEAVVTTKDGRRYDFSFVRTPFTPNWSRSNVRPRDDFVQLLRSKINVGAL